MHSVTFWNFLHAFWNILHAFWNILEHTACILEHSGTFCIHSVTFWNFLHAFWNILELYWLHTVKDFQLGTRTDGQTHRHTDIRTCRADAAKKSEKFHIIDPRIVLTENDWFSWMFDLQAHRHTSCSLVSTNYLVVGVVTVSGLIPDVPSCDEWCEPRLHNSVAHLIADWGWESDYIQQMHLKASKTFTSSNC